MSTSSYFLATPRGKSPTRPRVCAGVASHPRGGLCRKRWSRAWRGRFGARGRSRWCTSLSHKQYGGSFVGGHAERDHLSTISRWAPCLRVLKEPSLWGNAMSARVQLMLHEDGLKTITGKNVKNIFSATSCRRRSWKEFSIVASFAIEIEFVVRLPWSAIWYQQQKKTAFIAVKYLLQWYKRQKYTRQLILTRLSF